MTYTKINITKPSGGFSPGKGGDKKYAEIVLIDLNDLSAEAPRDSKGIVVVGNHTFKAGKYAIKFYSTPGTFSGESNSEGDIDAEGFIQTVVMDHPGSEKELREFLMHWLDKNVMIIAKRCSDGTMDQFGTSCAPLRLQVASKDAKDSNKSILTFKSALKGPYHAIYEGTITFSEPVGEVPAEATSIDLTPGSGEYQLTDNPGEDRVTITTCTNAVHGLVFTVLGSGGINPSEILESDFMLHNSAAWTGIDGATITFKCFQTGEDTFKFIELNRT